MRKYILYLFLSFFILDTVYSQILYSDNFDNHSWGNLGTDITGTIPGQWGWLTKSKGGTQTSSIFTIVNETNRGKVLDITAVSYYEELYVFKPNLNPLIDSRTTGNDVVKFEIDYFTGSIQPSSGGGIGNAALIGLLAVGEQVGGTLSPDYLVLFSFDKKRGLFGGRTSGNTEGLITNVPNGEYFLPFNTWVKLIAYLDYTNRKVYFEIPYFNKAFTGDFYKNHPSTNLIQDFKPATVSLAVFLEQEGQASNPAVTRNRYDNIKITALNAVPPEVINLSVNEQLASKFNLYPNPATNVVNITNSENMLVNKVVIYDTAGKQLSIQSFNNEAQIQLSVENLASGTYMLHLQTNKGLVVKKLVKK